MTKAFSFIKGTEYHTTSNTYLTSRLVNIEHNYFPTLVPA